MSEEWGPWIERGKPEGGMYVKLDVENRELGIASRHVEGFISWNGGAALLSPEPDLEGFLHDWSVTRYRVRRPKALQKLIQMVENLPALSKEMEPV